METITLTFLGTGNAVPTKLRNHTAILLAVANESMLIDCGEGTQRQFRYADLSPAKLTRLLITHWHGDHVLGLPGLFQTLAMSDYQKTLALYGPRGTSQYIAQLQDLFKDFKISINVREGYGTLVETSLLKIEAMPMTHGAPNNAYTVILKDRRRLDKEKLKKLKLPNTPMLGELQAGRDIVFNGKKITAKSISYLEEGKKVAFVFDTALNDNAIKIAENADILVCESTFSEEEAEKAAEYRHLTASQAATIAKKAKAKQLILTHISQRYEHSLSIIEKEAKKVFKNTRIVKDLDVITI